MYWKFHLFFPWKPVKTNEFVICQYSVNNLWKQMSLYRLFKRTSLTVHYPDCAKTNSSLPKNLILNYISSLCPNSLFPPQFFINHLVLILHLHSIRFYVCFFCCSCSFCFSISLEAFSFSFSWSPCNFPSLLRDHWYLLRSRTVCYSTVIYSKLLLWCSEFLTWQLAETSMAPVEGVELGAAGPQGRQQVELPEKS